MQRDERRTRCPSRRCRGDRQAGGGLARRCRGRGRQGAAPRRRAWSIDDTAVTPRYVHRLHARPRAADHRQDRARLAPQQVAVPAAGGAAAQRAAPWPITPLLMIGGTYLCYEGAEKLWRSWCREHAHEDAGGRRHGDRSRARAGEGGRGAIRTDFILSAEIMAIALAEVADEPLLDPRARRSVARRDRDHGRRLWRRRPDREDGRHRPASRRERQRRGRRSAAGWSRRCR